MKQKLYFAEHLILNFFSQGVSIALGLPIMLSYFLIPQGSYMILGVVSMILGIIVVSYVNSRFFKGNIILSIIKYILNYPLLFVQIFILSILAGFVHGNAHQICWI